MLTLLAGLVLFLGAHSTRIYAEGWRAGTIAQIGEKKWKGVYSLVSIAGFVLIVVGYGMARQDRSELWHLPPVWTHHLAALLVLFAFVLIAAAYVPRNQLKATVGHPMVLGVLVWALGHLIANNTVADVLLFGSFLAWSAVDFAASRKRDAVAGTVYPPGTASRTALAVVIGAVAWAVFAFWLHRVWIGVQPLGVGL